MTSEPPKATSTQLHSIDANPCQGQPLFLPVPRPGPHTSGVGNPNLPPSPQWCLKITAGQDTRRLTLLTSGTPSFHDVLVGGSALFCLPPTSVGSSLLLCYRDSDEDSCTLTSATFPDALPLFLNDHVIRLSAAAIHRNVCASPASPRAPPSVHDNSPLPFAQANVYTPPRHAMARLEADRSLCADIRRKDQDAALAKWRIDHHANLFRPLPDRPSLNSFVMSPPKASKFFVPSKQASFHPHKAIFLEPLARLQTRHTPPGPLPANALSLVPEPPATFSRPLGGFSVNQVWLGLLRLGQAVTNRSVPSLLSSTTGTQEWSTFSVGMPTFIVSSQVQSTRPGLVPAPTTPDPTRHSSTRRRKRNTHLANPGGPPTGWRHPSSTSPSSSPVPFPSHNFGSFSALAQPDTQLFDVHSAQPPDHQIPRRRAFPQGPLAPAAFSENSHTLADGDVPGKSCATSGGPYVHHSAEALPSSPVQSQDSTCRSDGGTMGTISISMFLICLLWLHSCLLAGVSPLRTIVCALLFSWLPSPRKIRRRRRQFRGYSNQLAHRRLACGRSRCLMSLGSQPDLSGPDFSRFGCLTLMALV